MPSRDIGRQLFTALMPSNNARTCPPALQWITVTHQCLVLNLLSDEFVLAEGVARLSGDGVYGSLLHLLFDGAEQHEERLASTLLLFWKASRGLERKVGEKGNETQGWKWRGRRENCFHQAQRAEPRRKVSLFSSSFLNPQRSGIRWATPRGGAMCRPVVAVATQWWWGDSLTKGLALPHDSISSHTLVTFCKDIYEKMCIFNMYFWPNVWPGFCSGWKQST